MNFNLLGIFRFWRLCKLLGIFVVGDEVTASLRRANGVWDVRIHPKLRPRHVTWMGIQLHMLKHIHLLWLYWIIFLAFCNLRVSKPRQVHPYFQQPELLEFCRQKNLQVHAFSPLAHGELGLLEDRLLTLGASISVSNKMARKGLKHIYFFGKLELNRWGKILDTQAVSGLMILKHSLVIPRAHCGHDDHFHTGNIRRVCKSQQGGAPVCERKVGAKNSLTVTVIYGT